MRKLEDYTVSQQQAKYVVKVKYLFTKVELSLFA
jgi:hypothetical protein